MNKMINILENNSSQSDDMLYQLDRLKYIVQLQSGEKGQKKDSWEIPFLQTIYESIN